MTLVSVYLADTERLYETCEAIDRSKEQFSNNPSVSSGNSSISGIVASINNLAKEIEKDYETTSKTLRNYTNKVEANENNLKSKVISLLENDSVAKNIPVMVTDSNTGANYNKEIIEHNNEDLKKINDDIVDQEILKNINIFVQAALLTGEMDLEEYAKKHNIDPKVLKATIESPESIEKINEQSLKFKELKNEIEKDKENEKKVMDVFTDSMLDSLSPFPKLTQAATTYRSIKSLVELAGEEISKITKSKETKTESKNNEKNIEITNKITSMYLNEMGAIGYIYSGAKSLITGEEYSDVLEETKEQTKDIKTKLLEVKKSTNALSADALVSLTQGVLNFGEEGVKTLELLSTADEMVSDGYKSILKIITNKDSLKEFEERNIERWNEVGAFVSTEHIESLYDKFYDETDFGKMIKENAPYHEQVREISSGIGYLGASLFTGSIASGAITEGVALAPKAVNLIKSLTNAFVYGSARFGGATGDAINDGASMDEALLYGGATGVKEASGMFIGNIIQGWNPFHTGKPLKIIGNSLLHVGLDTLDGAASALIDPILQSLYTPSEESLEARGYKLGVDSYRNLSFKERYVENFNANGGVSNIIGTAVFSGAMSLLSEIPDMTKNIIGYNQGTSLYDEIAKTRKSIQEAATEEEYDTLTDKLSDLYKKYNNLKDSSKYYFDLEKIKQEINVGNITSESLNFLLDSNNTKEIFDSLTNEEKLLLLDSISKSEQDKIFESLGKTGTNLFKRKNKEYFSNASDSTTTDTSSKIKFQFFAEPKTTSTDMKEFLTTIEDLSSQGKITKEYVASLTEDQYKVILLQVDENPKLVSNFINVINGDAAKVQQVINVIKNMNGDELAAVIGDNKIVAIGFITRNAINNLDESQVTETLIKKVANLDDTRFKQFIQVNTNNTLFENEEILDRAIATATKEKIDLISGLSNEIQFKIISNKEYVDSVIGNDYYKIASTLKKLSPENSTFFLKTIDANSLKFDDKIKIVSSLKNYEEIQNIFFKESNLFLDDKLKLMSLNQKVDFIDTIVDPNIRQKFIEESGVINKTGQLSSSKLYDLISNVSDEKMRNDLIFNPENIERLSSKITDVMTLLTTEDQLKLIDQCKVNFNRFNYAIKGASSECLQQLFESNPKLIEVLDSNNLLASYLKTSNDNILNEIKTRIDLDELSIMFLGSKSEETVSCLSVLSGKINDNDLEKILGYAEIKDIINLIQASNNENSGIKDRLMLSLIKKIQDSGSITPTNLKDISQVMSKSEINDLLSKVTYKATSSYEASIEEIKVLFESLDDENIEKILNGTSIDDIIKNVDDDKIYDYFLKKIKATPTLSITDVDKYSYSGITIKDPTRFKTVYEHLDSKGKMLLVNDKTLEDALFTKEIKKLVIEEPTLINSLPEKNLKNFFEKMSKEEIMTLLPNTTPELLVKIYSKDILDNSEKNIVKNILINKINSISGYTQVSFFKLLDSEEKKQFLESLTRIDTFDLTDYVRCTDDDEMKKKIFELYIEGRRKDGFKLPFSAVANTLNANDLSIFEQALDDKSFISYLIECNTDSLDEKIMERFKRNLGLFSNPNSEIVLQKMNDSTREEVVRTVKEKGSEILKTFNLSKMENSDFLNVIGYSKLITAQELGYLNQKSCDVLQNIFIKNPNVLKTINIDLLNPETLEIGELFIEKMSRYQKEAYQVIDLQKDSPEKFKIFKILASELSNEDELSIYNEKLVLLLKYFEKNDDIIEITPSEAKTYFDYIVGEHSFFDEGKFEGMKTITDKITLGHYSDDYQKEFCDHLDNLFKNATTLEEKKNILITKMFGISTQEADCLLKTYYSNLRLEDVEKCKELIGTESIDFIFQLNNVFNINDESIIEQLYKIQQGDRKEILKVMSDLRKVYAKTYNEQLKVTADLIEDRIARCTLTKPISEFNFDNFSGECIVEINGKQIPIVEVPEEFNIMAHSTCAYGSMELVNNNYSDSWNYSDRTTNHGICCSYITDSKIGTANVRSKGVLLGFSGFSDESIQRMGPYDIYSRNDDIGSSSGKQPLFVPAQNVSTNTVNVYNEFVIERTELRDSAIAGYNNIQPDYVIVLEEWNDELKQNALKAAFDFNPPLKVVYIDRKKVATNAAKKIDTILDSFSKTHNLSYFEEALNIHESTRTSFWYSKDIVDYKSVFPTSKISTSIENYLTYIKKFSEEVPECNELYIGELERLKEIIQTEQFRFNGGSFHVDSKTDFDIDSVAVVEEINNLIKNIKGVN